MVVAKSSPSVAACHVFTSFVKLSYFSIGFNALSGSLFIELYTSQCVCSVQS